MCQPPKRNKYLIRCFCTGHAPYSGNPVQERWAGKEHKKYLYLLYTMDRHTTVQQLWGKKNQLPSLLLDKNADWLAVRIRISCKTHPSISEFEIIFLLNLKKTLLGPFRPFCIFFGKVLFSLCWFQLLVSIGCSGQRERSWWCFGRACWKPWTPVFCTAQLKVKICCWNDFTLFFKIHLMSRGCN